MWQEYIELCKSIWLAGMLLDVRLQVKVGKLKMSLRRGLLHVLVLDSSDRNVQRTNWKQIQGLMPGGLLVGHVVHSLACKVWHCELAMARTGASSVSPQMCHVTTHLCVCA
jgi:hypothetical protein